MNLFYAQILSIDIQKSLLNENSQYINTDFVKMDFLINLNQ